MTTSIPYVFRLSTLLWSLHVAVVVLCIPVHDPVPLNFALAALWTVTLLPLLWTLRRRVPVALALLAISAFVAQRALVMTLLGISCLRGDCL
jgi:hypothetical protein